MANLSEQTETRRRAQEAKEYLIAQIVEEAERENVPLSEIERKMLYFMESEKTLPDIYDVNDQFEQEYDDAEYEAKISHLLRHARRRMRQVSPDEAQRWEQAERDLRREDHYLGVMVGNSLKPVGGFWTVAIWSAAIIGVIFGAIVLWLDLEEKHMIPEWVNRVSTRAWAWGSIAAMFIFVIVMNSGFGNLKDLASRACDFISIHPFPKRFDNNK